MNTRLYLKYGLKLQGLALQMNRHVSSYNKISLIFWESFRGFFSMYITYKDKIENGLLN